MQQPALLTLTNRDAETMMVVHEALGFSQVLVGYPELDARSLRPSNVPLPPGLRRELTPDAVFHATAVDVEVRYFFDVPGVPAKSPLDLARKQAEAFLRLASLDAKLTAAKPAYLEMVAADGAVRAEYDLARADGGTTHEELLCLVRNGKTVIVCYRHDPARVDPLKLLNFLTVARAGLSWDRSRPRVVPQVWPDSPFLLPGVGAELRPERLAQAELFADVFRLPEAEGQAVALALENVMAGQEPPWFPLAPRDVRDLVRELLAGTTSTPLWQLVFSLSAGVRTVRDMQGIAVFLARTATYAWAPELAQARAAVDVEAPTELAQGEEPAPVSIEADYDLDDEDRPMTHASERPALAAAPVTAVASSDEGDEFLQDADVDVDVDADVEEVTVHASGAMAQGAEPTQGRRSSLPPAMTAPRPKPLVMPASLRAPRVPVVTRRAHETLL